MNINFLFRRITNSGKFVKYFSMETELKALRGQLLWRSRNLGMK